MRTEAVLPAAPALTARELAGQRTGESAPPRLGPPPLRPWSRIWRYLVAVTTGAALWLAVSVDLIEAAERTPEITGPVGAALLLDALLGLVALCLLPLRRRHPLLTALLVAAFGSVSAFSFGPAAVATVSMATWRRWRWVVSVVLTWGAATVVYEGLWRPLIVGETQGRVLTVLSGGLAVGIVAACVATGFYIGARRELLVNLRMRAETAEREQALKAAAAREAERTRIAREMHDVLAHRISLVAMHAGALAYRTDLTPEETAEAAGVIQHNAHLALTELRQVLGVLRAGSTQGGEEAAAEPPQPELAQVDELVDAAQPYVEVTVDAGGLPGGTLSGAALPATTSRTAYRVVQEALTNACKHAPGSAVLVRLAGAPGGLLTVEVDNSAPGLAHQVPATPGAGLGLLGLTERVELAGGALEHSAGPDGSFGVRAWLPWEDER